MKFISNEGKIVEMNKKKQIKLAKRQFKRLTSSKKNGSQEKKIIQMRKNIFKCAKKIVQ